MSVRGRSDSRLGLVLPPQNPHLTAGDLIELGVLADRCGYDLILVPEAMSYEAPTLVGALSQATANVEIGTGVVTIPVRSPALTAMAALTADSISDGRFVLGLGMGHESITTTWHGLPYEASAKRFREYVEIVRGVLRGGTMDFVGEHLRCTDLGLGVTPLRPDIPIYLAALSLSTMRLAGEVADGILAYYAPPAHLAKALAAVDEARRAAGRDDDAVDVCLMVPTEITDAVGPAREAARAQIAWYGNLDLYNRMFSRAGFADEAAELRRRWAESENWESEVDGTGAASAVSDDLLEAIFVIGDDVACRQAIEDYREVGVTTPAIYPQGVFEDRASSMEGYKRTIEAFARSPVKTDGEGRQ
jgi:alkanesulfonate monooxygenase SsuD/methylene tetrahydromethanopterin reductase-like flavin-dependent oxidoreductase (luciferase family)